MQNQQLYQNLKAYIDDPNSNYAFMITGEWGAGKTYFFKEYFLPEISKNNSVYNFLYISLYGISTIEEIDKKIFIELNFKGFSDNKIVKAGSEIAKIVLTLGSKFLEQKTGIECDKMLYQKIDYDKILNLENLVICFDDLERCKLNYEEIFGYINNFSEHDRIKVLIICNEEHIDSKDDKNNYYMMKEKTVPKTYKFISDDEETIITILKFFDSQFETDDILKDTNLLKGLFLKYEKKNYRIFKTAISDFIFIRKHLKDYKSAHNLKFNDKEYNELEKLILFFIFGISSLKLEIDEENMNINDFKEMDNTTFHQLRLSDNKRDKKREFISKYSIKYFFKSVFDYITTNIFDEILFKSELKNHYFILHPDEQKDIYQKFLDTELYNTEDDEFDKILNEVYLEAKKSKYELNQYYEIFMKFSLYKKINILPENILDFDIEILDWMDKAVLTIPANFKGFRLNDNLYEEIIKSENYNNFYQKFNEMNQKIKSEYNEKEISKIIKLIENNNFEEFKSKFEIDKNNFFTYMEPEKFLSTLLKTSNANKMIVAEIIKSSYNNTTNNEIKKNLEELKNIIEKYLKNQKPKASNYIFKSFFNDQ